MNVGLQGVEVLQFPPKLLLEPFEQVLSSFGQNHRGPSQMPAIMPSPASSPNGAGDAARKEIVIYKQT
jgi:hypothetical protein